MSNVLNEGKRQQVLALGQLGWSLRQIEEATGVRRETASGYLKRAGIGLRSPGRWGRGPPNPANETAQVTADSLPGKQAKEDEPGAANPANEVTADSERAAKSRCAVYHEVIIEALRRGRNAVGIYQQLVDNHGFADSYESVKRYVRALRGNRSPQAHPVIETAPGQESQVDYGEGPMVRDPPKTGKYRRTRLFLMTLGHSRKSVRLLCLKSSAETWAKLHEESFRRLGGATKTTVLDNLKEGVLKPDVYDPQLNPLYRDVLRHYGVVALPCRVRHPNRKGKVESGIGHTQKTPLKGMHFDSLEEAQSYLDRWDERWGNTRIHGTTKRQVAAMFAEEKPHLLPLPAEPFRYYRFGTRTVHLDGCVEVEGAYYMSPPGHIGRLLHIQWDALHVRLIDPRSATLLREHIRTGAGRYRIAPQDRPASTPPSTLRLLSRASNAGKSIGALCAEIHRREPDGAPRRILGVLALARKYGLPAVETGCALALEGGVPTYRFVRSYVEHHPTPALDLKQVDELIRPLTQYRDLISRITEAQQSQPPPNKGEQP
jgi:transposase